MAHLLQLKLILANATPPIWRKILIDDSLTFEDLHNVIQSLMDWENYHLYDFCLNDGTRITRKNLDDVSFEDEEPLLEADKTLLSSHIKQKKQAFLYVYDFGDNWEIQITVEAIIPMQVGDKRVCCISGKRKAPPEDCGGIFSYMNAVKTLRYKDDPEYEDLREWYGDDFDSEYFDLNEINKRLDSYNKKRRRGSVASLS